MNQFRFDGRTAIVTGAGGNPSLGRAHAMLLAARGANVVVNDIGRLPPELGYPDLASAEAVAAEIRTLGGEAVADTHSIATDEGAQAIVQTALDAYGGVDILVNNAAICIVASFDEITPKDFQRHIDINLLGTVAMCRAAWPHMRAKGYGRIVNVSSLSMAGFDRQGPYATSKGGVFSLTRALAAEGARYGIKVNTLFPGAFTRMVLAQHGESSTWRKFSSENLPPEVVSPVMAFLAHEACPVTGEGLISSGGEVARVYLARTAGFTDPDLTIERVASRFEEAMGGEPEGIIRNEGFDPSTWDIKPYQPIA